MTDGRYVEDFSLPTDASDVVKTIYRYDVIDGTDWMTLFDFDDLGKDSVKMFPFLGTDRVPNSDFYQSYQQTITERQSFVVRVPKNTSTIYLKLEATYVQIYFDESLWTTASKLYFDINKATKTITLSSC